MKKAVIISVFVHLFIIFPALFFLVSSDNIQSTADSVKIRILSSSLTAGKVSGFSDNKKDGYTLESKSNFPAQIPETGMKNQESKGFYNSFTAPGQIKPVPAGFTESTKTVYSADIPETSGFINESFSVPDPLEGMEELIKYPSTENANQNRIKVMWDFSGNRGIVFYPEINLEKKEADSIRLTDIKIKIRVSQKGDVLTAEVIPPGSGVPAVDRMLYDSALKLIFEPGDNNNRTIEGILNIKILSRDTASGREAR